MAKRPSVTTISSGFASNTQLNTNFTAIQSAFDNTLSLDGSTPNAMGANLDLNGNDILNVNSATLDSLYVGGIQIVGTGFTSQTYATRASFVAANASTPGLGLSDGNVVVAGGYEYRRLAASTAIADLLGWVPNGWGCFEQWGAIGDGVADDATAINSALSSWQYTKGSPGATYLINSSVTCPSNRTVDFNGATVKRNFFGDWAFKTENAETTWDASDVNLFNISLTDGGTLASRGNGLLLVGDRISLDGYKNTFSAPGDGVMGAWACYASGVDIQLSRININNSDCGLFADGVHVGYVENFTLTDFNIQAGDDAFALFAPRLSFAFGGKDQRAKNVSVEGGFLSSADANGVRIGNWGAANGIADPRTNFTFENVKIDAVFGACKETAVMVFDSRTGVEIVGKSTDITINARVAENASITRLVNVTGNSDITSSAQLSQRNFGRVNIYVDGVTSNSASGSVVRAGGFDYLRLSGYVSFDAASAVSTTHMFYSGGGTLLLDGLTTKGETTGTVHSVKWIEEVIANDCEHLTDGTSEFQTYSLALATEVGMSFYLKGGRVLETARAINITGTGRLKDFVVEGCQVGSTLTFPSSTTFSSVTWDAGGIAVFNPLGGYRATVANLMGSGVPVVEGHQAIATNGRKAAEGAGAGTGQVVYRNGTSWRCVRDDSVVVA